MKHYNPMMIQSPSQTVGPYFAQGLLRDGDEHLTASVAVNYREVAGDGGNVAYERNPEEDLNELRTLVMNAVGYDETRGDRITVEVEAERADMRLHVLLPEGRRARRATVGGSEAPLTTSLVEQSPYADLETRVEGGARIVIDLD